MKRLKVITALAMLIFVLTGCTDYAEQYDKNTLVLKKNGSLVEVSVEDFKGTSVGADSLISYVESQIESYNNSAGNVIKMESINTEDMSKVKLVVSYKDIDCYNSFNLLDYKYKDISDVKESELTGSFTSADDKKAKPADIMAEKKAKVFTVSEATDVVIKGELLYYNDEVTVKDGVATTSGKKDSIFVIR
ncbi:MAG: hypothetical protein E7271_02155 [Lachnospiraceae bacterium]|nr:hypothetical protein [Lachnospiraceae bacterium]